MQILRHQFYNCPCQSQASYTFIVHYINWSHIQYYSLITFHTKFIVRLNYFKCETLTCQQRTDTMIPRFSVSFLLIISVAIIIRSALNNDGGSIYSLHCQRRQIFLAFPGGQSKLARGETYKRTFLNPKLVPHLEITNFTIANATNVLIECGFACNKNGADCNAMFVQGIECHLLKVGYMNINQRKIFIKC